MTWKHHGQVKLDTGLSACGANTSPVTPASSQGLTPGDQMGVTVTPSPRFQLQGNPLHDTTSVPCLG